MTYFGFLVQFLGPPLLLLSLFTIYDQWHGHSLPEALGSWPASFVILAHVIVAVLYTTPWDNYLVAAGVWWYNPKLVTGIVLGWVPIEEYTFFILQTLLTGLWVVFLAKRLSFVSQPISLSPHLQRMRWMTITVLAIVWLSAIGLLFAGWKPGTYLALELAWSLPPLIFQLAFAGDILWYYRTLVFWSLVPVTLYLSIGDALAIRAGTWTIDPMQSTSIFFGALPLEELVFFFMTNLLVVFGMILVLAQESQTRAPKAWLSALRRDTVPGRVPVHPIHH